MPLEVNHMDYSNLMKAIEIRCSRRNFHGKAIDPTILLKLKEIAAECSASNGIRLELVTNNGKAFSRFTKSYGMFSGVNDYVCLIADNRDITATERLGYYGELFVLHATNLGLSTCWVGGSFDRNTMPVKLSENETIVCAILVGSTNEKRGFREKLIHSITHRKTKTAEDMFVSDSTVPDWFMQGLEAVQKAPSAVNRQPVMFSYKNNKVSASIKNMNNIMQVLDFGIAKLHFEIGASGGEWAWGNGGEFVHRKHLLATRCHEDTLLLGSAKQQFEPPGIS